MPIFEYECAACRSRFELLVSGADDSSRACPSCGAAKPRRLLSTFAVLAAPAPRTGSGCCGAGPDAGHCACRPS
jgi:putative FmdB family regulatory protein